MTQEVRNTLPPQARTIFGVPACTNIDELSADVAFIGFPYDHGQVVDLTGGQKWAPKFIRDYDQRKCYKYFGDSGCPEEACGWFDYDSGEWKLRGVTMADCGDINVLPEEGASIDKPTNCDKLTEVVRKILARGAFPVVIGGEHTQGSPVTRAFDKFAPLDIVYLDSHLDFTDSIEGAKINNADPIRRISELPFIHNITGIGITPRERPGRQGKEEYDAAVARGLSIITPNRFRQMGAKHVVDSIPQAKNIYVTIDIDCMDCSVVPAISGREVGGLSYLDVEQVLMGIPTRGKVVGFDVNGLIPAWDTTRRTARVVVNLIEDFLAAIFPSKK